MNHQSARTTFASILVLLACADVASAQRGGRGGMVGNRGGGGGGGGGRPAAASRENFSRPAAPPRENFSRPAAPPRENFNRQAPAPRENFNRPNINENINRQNINRENINRPNITENINRENVNRVNINRPNITENITRENINRNQTNLNTFSNNRPNNFGPGTINRGGYGGGLGGYGGYGGGNRAWGYGGYGGGPHLNSYYGYHSNWVNGSWGGPFRPGWGNYGYYGNNLGYGALGLGALGVSAWGLGSLYNSWGYNQYANPYYGSGGFGQPAYVAQQAGPYDYSRPLDLASSPPPESVIQTAEQTLDGARQAFRAGDYPGALAQADQALSQTPNDPMLHEFRAICLFALGRYDEAAAPLYTVLSVGPGWDWTTLIGLYPDAEAYTAQLRAIEAFCRNNPRAASARFVLASLYLTQGSTDAAAAKLREVIALQPQDRLSSQLLDAINGAGKQLAQAPANDNPPANPVPAEGGSPPPQAPPLPTGAVPTNLIGSWSASPAKDVTISLTVNNDDKTFRWKVVEKGQAREFQGQATSDNDVLALAPPEMPPMVGKVTWKDPGHFQFKAVGGPADDPGLDFGKSS